MPIEAAVESHDDSKSMAMKSRDEGKVGATTGPVTVSTNLALLAHAHVHPRRPPHSFSSCPLVLPVSDIHSFHLNTRPLTVTVTVHSLRRNEYHLWKAAAQ